ncbi:putative coatomer subunit zeta [Erysiphe necator]|nr:putative coatomer subunit zeta [Erysiphe necator]
MIYVIGGIDENEVMLYNVIIALRDSLHLLFKQTVDKRTVIENYDLVALTVDEIVDDGIILETDSTIIAQRVSKAPTQDVVQLKGIDLSEQGMNNLAQFGKAKLGDWLRQGL